MPKELREHSLHARQEAKPGEQPLRHYADEKRKPIRDEIPQLATTGLIEEIMYPDWLANPVLVEKKKSEDPFAVKVWRMCVDYTALRTDG